jgi:hypothetical protein
MPNVTISFDEDLLAKGRLYARKHKMSLNALLRKLLKARLSLNLLIGLSSVFC